MRQTLLVAPEQIEHREVPLPRVESGWVLAKTLRTGICGTDVHSYYGETIFGKVFPFHIGHEVCAEVVKVDPDNQSLQPGDWIVINPFFTCGACPACYAGMENNCAHKTTIGLKGFGGFSEYVYVPSTSAVKVSSHDPSVMCLAEPLSTVIYGIDKLRLDSTKRVLIQGTGPIGLMFLQIVKAQMPAYLAASDFSEEKLRRAAQLGADATFCPLKDEDSRLLNSQQFDVVIDCTGSIKSMQTTVDRISFGGQILLFGLCSAEASMEIKPFRLYQKDASIITSFALNKKSFRKAVTLLEKGAIRTDLLIDSIQPLSRLEESLQKLAAGKADGKIIIDTTR